MGVIEDIQQGEQILKIIKTEAWKIIEDEIQSSINSCVENLKHEKDFTRIYWLQGEINALQKVLNIPKVKIENKELAEKEEEKQEGE